MSGCGKSTRTRREASGSSLSEPLPLVHPFNDDDAENEGEENDVEDPSSPLYVPLLLLPRLLPSSLSESPSAAVPFDTFFAASPLDDVASVCKTAF